MEIHILVQIIIDPSRESYKIQVTVHFTVCEGSQILETFSTRAELVTVNSSLKNANCNKKEKKQP